MIELEYTKTVIYFWILLFIVYAYMYCRWRSSYQEWRGGVEIRLNPLRLSVPRKKMDFQRYIPWFLYVQWVQLRW